MNRRLVTVGFVTLVLAAGTGAWVFAQQTRPATTPVALAISAVAEVSVPKAVDDDSEVVMAFADLPEAVRTAVLKITAEGNITRVAKEEDGGPTSFEIQYTENGTAHEIDLNAAGVLEADGEDDTDCNAKGCKDGDEGACNSEKVVVPVVDGC